MVEKFSKNKFDKGTTWIGNLLLGIGVVGSDGVNFDILSDAIMEDPLKFAIMAGLWVAFYVTGKEPSSNG